MRGDEEQKPLAVQAPDGKVIEFPKEMTREQITNVMRELYPPPHSPYWEKFHVLIWAMLFPVLTVVVWFTGLWVLAGFKM